jgi:hypothetical protein
MAQAREPTDRREFLRSVGALGAAAVLGAPQGRSSRRHTAGTPVAVGEAERPGPATTAFMDGLWDEGLGQIRFPFEEQPPPVRETSWYALGLLQRDDRGDADRARRALESVLARQYDSPGAIFHGSYARFAGDPPIPPTDAVEFREFDPNWRQFIGTALALAVERFGTRLGSLGGDVERSIELAAAGERPDRVEPDYSNIALMHAWLLAYTGSRRPGEDLARAVARRYRDAGALDEYNSPTYDGVALYALALWREEPPSPVFADLGDELYAGVWRDVAATYHAGLRNACGPFSRAVGMDQRTYATPTGLWIWSVVGRDAAPFPNLSQPFEHAGDVCFGPLVELFSPDVPNRARAHLEEFRGERTVRAGLDGAWEATSWLGERVMLGGHTGIPVRVGGAQLHPVTVHWDGGWIRVRGDGPIEAVATRRHLDVTVSPPGPASVTIGVAGLDPAAVGADRWELPGLRVDVSAGAPPAGAPAVVEEGVEIEYPPTTLGLDVSVG